MITQQPQLDLAWMTPSFRAGARTAITLKKPVTLILTEPAPQRIGRSIEDAREKAKELEREKAKLIESLGSGSASSREKQVNDKKLSKSRPFSNLRIDPRSEVDFRSNRSAI